MSSEKNYVCINFVCRPISLKNKYSRRYITLVGHFFFSLQGKMSTLKKCLKEAKSSIELNDPESALEAVEEALEFDSENYFAYIFQGKSYQLLRDNDKAIASFEKATSIEPDNLLGWKGYFQAALSQTNYDLFFHVLTRIIEIQINQGIGIADTLKETGNYLRRNEYKSNTDLHEKYLRSIIPGTELGDLVGTNLGKPEDNIKELIDLVRRKENDSISRTISKEKMRFPRVLTTEQKNYLNKVAWTIHTKSGLSSLYETFLNICNADDLRAQYQEEYLKYKYELLKVAPEKSNLLDDIKDIMEGMVLVKTTSLFCWTLYWDWIDIQDFNQLEKDQIIFFLKHFQNEGLGMMLYAFLMSEISPFDKAAIVKELSNISKGSKAKEAKIDKIDEIRDENDIKLLEEIQGSEDTDNFENMLPADEVLKLMLDGYQKCTNSVLANRIICRYYIYLREYDEGAEKCRQAIKLLADLQRTLGINLINSREDILCSLAIIYTYYEAPKNYSRALQLYDRILETNSTNVNAIVGKGLILIEKNEPIKAKKLLEEVLENHPTNNVALTEFGWCEIRLGNYSSGRNVLIQALNEIKGMDLNSRKTRATVHWRIAKSYILENKGSENINEAYDHLIKSLKDSQNHAPSYSLLGVLYKEYFNDYARSQKCFYKAFELDVSEIDAAKYLVEDLTAKNDWDIAEILCKRIVQSEISRRLLLSQSFEDKDRSWPYRVLGCSALNKQDDAKAVEWFQTALRMAAMDKECWIGLGEAYYNCGRLDAASKVFRHSLDIADDSWVVKYMLGLITCEMGEFEGGLLYLEDALTERPEEECILGAIYESMIENANKLVAGGFFGRAMESVTKAIGYISRATKINQSSQNMWMSLGNSLRIFLIIQGHTDVLPLKQLSDIFGNIDFSRSTNQLLKEANEIDEGITFEKAIKLIESEENLEGVSLLVILAAKAAVNFLPSKVGKLLISVVYYNLGLAYLECFNHIEKTIYRESAIKFFKKAIQLESGNAAFWIGLGNSYVSSNPQVAQHCFIKATSLESRDGDIWTNLAALYLRYGDSELAQQAFARAQSVAPQNPQPWLGNALAAQASGEGTKASNLFTHAYILSNGRSPLALLLYGLAIIDKRILASGSDPRDIETAQEFSVANFAMTNFLKFSPNDEAGLKVALIIAERCKNYDSGIQIGVRLCSLLEKKYEKTESQVALSDYAKAKAQLARLYLGICDYEKALENAQMVMDILDSENEAPEYQACILSSRVIIGLAFFLNDQFDEALEQLQLILTDHNDSARLITLTAQILHAYGAEETKQAALDQLFSYIEQLGSSLIVVLTLGAIAIVDDLDDFFPAIRDELRNLSLTQLTKDAFRAVPKLLYEINSRLDSTNQDQIWQRNAILFPLDYSIWKQLNNNMALAIASLRETKINAVDFSNSCIKIGELRQIQRGLIVYPASDVGRKALNGCFT